MMTSQNTILNLWDFDGTLFDTEPALYKVYSQALREVTGHILTPEVWQSKCSSSAYALEEHYGISHETMVKVRDRKYELYPHTLYDGIFMINHVRQFWDHPLALNYVCTHTNPDVAETILDKFEIRPWFKRVYGLKDVGHKAKPDPAMYLLAMGVGIIESHGIIKHINIFEDSDFGLGAAANTKNAFDEELYKAFPPETKLTIYKVTNEGINEYEAP